MTHGPVSDAQERLSVTHDPVSGNQERVSVTLEPVSVIPSAFVAQEPAPGTQERVSCDSGARFCDSRAGLSDSKSLSVSQERVSLTQELVSVTQERASVTQGFVLAFQARFSSNSRARFCESGVSCGSDRGSHAGRVAAGTARKQRETHAMHTRDPKTQQTT